MDATQRLHVSSHDPFASAALLGDQACAFEHRNVLLHRRERHGVVGGQFGHVRSTRHRAADDVAPGGVGERPEDPVHLRLTPLSYNHLVVG